MDNKTCSESDSTPHTKLEDLQLDASVRGFLPDCDEFLAQKHRLMALRIEEWFEVLS